MLFAWGWGPRPGGWGAGNDGWYHQGSYQNGYYAGTHDAIYDHENNLVYTDQPSCLSCHSQLYYIIYIGPGPNPNPNPNSDFNLPGCCPNCLGSNNIPCDGDPDP